MKFKIGILICVLFALSSVTAFANTVPPFTPEKTYWVDGTSSSATYGDDTNTGLSETQALRTIGQAIILAKAETRVSATSGGNWGHIIIIKAGTYNETLSISGDNDLNYLTIMSYSTDPSAVKIGTGAVGNSNITISVWCPDRRCDFSGYQQ